MTKEGRNGFWQEVRGICIIAVIVIHCLGIESIAGDATLVGPVYILRQMVEFPVGVFVFLAGLFVKPQKLAQGISTYYKTRLKKLVIPFLFWTCFYSFAKVGFSFLSDARLDIVSVLIKAVTGRAVAPLYYVVVLVQLVLLTPALLRMVQNSKRFNWLFFCITPAYLLLLSIYAIYTNTRPNYYEYPFWAWSSYYYLGLWVSAKGFQSIPRYRLWVPGLVLSLNILLLIPIRRLNLPVQIFYSQLRPLAFLYAMAMILYFVSASTREKPEKCDPLHKGLKKMGDESYGIYYVHLFWVLLFGEGVSLWEMSISGLVVLFVGVVFAVVMSLTSIYIVKKLLKEKAWLVGF